MDEHRAALFNGAKSLRIPNVAVALEEEPAVLAVRDSVVAVGGNQGIQLFSSMDVRLMPVGTRAAVCMALARSISHLAAAGSRSDPAPDSVHLSAERGPGVLVQRANMNAVAAAETRIFAAVENRVESVPVNADSTRDWRGTSLSAPVRDILVG